MSRPLAGIFLPDFVGSPFGASVESEQFLCESGYVCAALPLFVHQVPGSAAFNQRFTASRHYGQLIRDQVSCLPALHPRVESSPEIERRASVKYEEVSMRR